MSSMDTPSGAPTWPFGPVRGQTLGHGGNGQWLTGKDRSRSNTGRRRGADHVQLKDASELAFGPSAGQSDGPRRGATEDTLFTQAMSGRDSSGRSEERRC